MLLSYRIVRARAVPWTRSPWVRRSIVVLLLCCVGAGCSGLGPTLSGHRGSGHGDSADEALEQGNPVRREIALTIDDGPHEPIARQFLDILRAEGVRATFFVVGKRVREHPGVVARMVGEGHEVGSHTATHQRLDTLTEVRIRAQLVGCEEAVRAACGRRMNLLRPPGARYNATAARVAEEAGYHLVGWTVAAKDFVEVPSDLIVDRVLASVGNGSIILLHDDYPETVTALPRIIRALKRQGYRFVTVSEMLAHLSPPVRLERNPPAPEEPIPALVEPGEASQP
ncbi:MAG: polysaccharide deacetylase family protein [Armatimonadetes bacterium]|nr:polysaccharide deacetylase family protein [Armatimonadota bacterium]